MVFYDGIKFACLSCIRGHRSSNCNHVDRPLMEVRKKGRPVSQCAYCRDLRKTKHIHAKCVCTASNKTTTTMATTNQPCRQEECTCTEKARVLLSSAKRRKTCSSSPRTTSSAGLATTTTTAAAAAAAAAAAVVAATSTTAAASQPPFLPQTEFDMLLAQPTLTQQVQQEPNEEDVASLFDSILQQQQQEQQQQEQLQLLQQQESSNANTTPTCATAISTSNNTSCTTATAAATNTAAMPSFCGSLIPQHTCLPQSLDAPAESVMVTITPLSSNIVPCTASIRTRIVTCYCGDNCTCPGCLVHQQNNVMFETSCPSSATSSCYNGSDDEQCHK